MDQTKTDKLIHERIAEQIKLLRLSKKQSFKMGKRFRNWVQKVKEKGQKNEKWTNFKSIFKSSLKEFGRQQLNTLVDNVLENESIANSSAGYAIKYGRDLANAGFITDDKARYKAIKDISEKSISSWQFRGKVNDVLTSNINKLIMNEEFKIKPKKNTDTGIKQVEQQDLPSNGIQRQYFIEGLQQDPDYVKKLHDRLKQIHDDPKTPKELKLKVYNISKALINFEKQTKAYEKTLETQDVILHSEKQEPILDQQDMGTDTVDVRDKCVMSFSDIIKDQMYKQYVDQQMNDLNGAQKTYAQSVCLTQNGLIFNCEKVKDKSDKDQEYEKLIHESIQQSAPKSDIEFSLLNYKKQKLELIDIIVSVQNIVKEISSMSGELDISLPVKKQKQAQKKRTEIPKEKNETTEISFRASNVSAFRTREI